MKIVEEEVDESMYWFELFNSTEVSSKDKVSILWKKENELLAITVGSINTVRKRLNSKK